MTDVSFRLSGGVTPEYTVEEARESGIQVIPQGIGYQDVPVSNTPPEGTGDILDDETVASGAFMQFMSDGWEAGKLHPRGSVVTDGEWTMVANDLTLDSPFPVPQGDDEFGVGTWVPTTQNDESVIYSGHRYTFTGPVWGKKLNVWVTELTVDTNYRIVIVTQYPDKPATTSILEGPVLAENQWVTVALFNTLIPAGTDLLVYIDALNSGGSQSVTGGWSYTGQDNVAAPVRGGWNQNNARNILRIDKFDLDGTDRTSELLGIGLNSTIQFANTDNPNAFDLYRVRSEPPIDQGTYIQYEVVLQQQGEGGVNQGTTTMTATIPIAQPTQYAQELGVVPTYTGPPVVAEGFLQFDGVDQGGQANTYGIDVEFESTEFSDDWDILAYNTP